MALPLLFGCLGFSAGLVILRSTMMWAFALWEAARDYRDKPRWMLVTVVLLHSGPWVLLATAFLAYRFLQPPLDSRQLGFIGGFVVYMAAISATLVRAWRHRRVQLRAPN